MPITAFDDIVTLEQRVAAAALPADLKEKLNGALARLSRLAQTGSYANDYDILSRYVGWLLQFPWQKQTRDVLDLAHAQSVLNANHHGLTGVKERILEYLSVLILHGTTPARAPMLALVGLVGTGKTSLAYSIAQALGRTYARIPFGGLGDALQLRGQPRHYTGAEPGLLYKALCRAGSTNPVILLDEIDRVPQERRADIMGVLVEMLDPEQNAGFIDHYVDYPVNLSPVLFIVTANNTTHISTAVLDRLEVLQMPSYTDEEKVAIGKQYLLPRILSEVGLPQDTITIERDVWPAIVRPLGFDAGMRTLERTLAGMARKMAKRAVLGKEMRFHITTSNVQEFLPQAGVQ